MFIDIHWFIFEFGSRWTADDYDSNPPIVCNVIVWLYLSEWGKVLHDEDLAAAILDRILERGRFIHLDGPSGRTRHINLEEALFDDPDRARISGISVPEFPEPTPHKRI